jgi:hypothetical protein
VILLKAAIIVMSGFSPTGRVSSFHSQPLASASFGSMDSPTMAGTHGYPIQSETSSMLIHSALQSEQYHECRLQKRMSFHKHHSLFTSTRSLNLRRKISLQVKFAANKHCPLKYFFHGIELLDSVLNNLREKVHEIEQDQWMLEDERPFGFSSDQLS